MTLLLRFAMVFFGTLLAAGLLALTELPHGYTLAPQVLAHQLAALHGVR